LGGAGKWLWKSWWVEGSGVVSGNGGKKGVYRLTGITVRCTVFQM
nr:hypothetical protein [Tanacetum cinerariifolium]